MAGVYATWKWQVLQQLCELLITKKFLIPLGNTKRELEMRGGEGNAFFRAKRWIEGN